MRTLPNWHSLEFFVGEIRAAFNAAESHIEVWDITVALRKKPSLEDAPDDRVTPKNALAYHDREAIAKAYESHDMWNMAAIEWVACARERAENCVAAGASIDDGHLKAIEFCIKR